MSDKKEPLREQKSPAERRHHRRHPLEAEVLYTWEGGEEHGRIIDISLGGLRLLTNGPLPLLQRLKIVIGRASETCVEGIIVWSSRIEAQHSVAIRFDSLTSSQQKALRLLLPEL